MSITLDLDPELEAYIEGLVASGRYPSTAEAVRGLLHDARKLEAGRARLREAVEAGLADIEAGRVHDIDDVQDELVSRYASRR